MPLGTKDRADFVAVVAGGLFCLMGTNVAAMLAAGAKNFKVPATVADAAEQAVTDAETLWQVLERRGYIEANRP